MPARSRVGMLLSALLFGALSARALECPPSPPDAEALWGLSAARWEAACLAGRDPLALLEETRVTFIRDCSGEFLAVLSSDTVRRECPQGRPGAERLRALVTARSAHPDIPVLRTASPRGGAAAGLSRLGAVGLDAAALDAGYTGAARRGDGAPAAAETAAPPPRPGAALRPATPTATASAPAVADLLRIPAEELERAVLFSPPPSVEKAFGERGAKSLGTLVYATERRFVAALLDRVQDSAEGRALLRGIVEESRLRGKTVKVFIEELPGTEIIREDGVESINGAVSGFAEPTNWRLTLNKAFMRFADAEGALNDGAATTAHELHHILLRSRVDRLLPRYSEVFEYDLQDEIAARLKGYRVAAELPRRRADSHSEDARAMLDDPDAYWESMKLWDSGYAMSLDREEMKDPVAAYTRRIQDLRDAVQEAEDERAALPARLRRIRHFESTHGLAARLRDLRETTEKRVNTVRQELKDLRESLREVQRRRSFLRSKAGRSQRDLIRRAALDPEYERLREDCFLDLAALRARTQEHPLPKAVADSDQIGWAELSALAEKDRLENPSHAREL